MMRRTPASPEPGFDFTVDEELVLKPLGAAPSLVEPPAPVTSSVQSSVSPHRNSPALRQYEGLVLDFGNAPFNFKKGESESFYVKLSTRDGERLVWGVDLERALDEAEAGHGSEISLKCLGQQKVIVPVKQYDDKGNYIGDKDEEVDRNVWQANVRSPELKLGPEVAVGQADLQVPSITHALIQGLEPGPEDNLGPDADILVMRGVDGSPPLHPGPAQGTGGSSKKLFSADFWDDCSSLYLRSVDKDGLREKIEITEYTVKFLLANQLGHVNLDTRDNSISIRGKLDPHQAAVAMIEIAKKAGWKTISFNGDKRFMEVAVGLAQKSGFQVVDGPTMASLLKARNKEKVHSPEPGYDPSSGPSM